MPVKGQITIEFIDSRTGEKTRPDLVLNNQITEYFYDDIVTIGGGGTGAIKAGNLLSYNNRIGVSNHAIAPVARQYTTLGNIKGSGATLANTKNHPNPDYSPWSYRPSESPPYVEIFNVLPYPGSGTRTFQTVFLARDASLADGTVIYAYVVAPNPVVQDTYEYINLYYKIINNSSDSLTALTPSLDKDVVNSLLSNYNSTYNGSDAFTASEFVAFPPPTLPYQYLRRSGNNYLVYQGQDAIATASKVSGYFSHRISATVPTRGTYDFVGQIINAVGVGNYDAKAAYYQIRPFEIASLASRYQGYFPHNAQANTPFIDVSQTPKPASGSGTLALAGAWTGTLPEQYRVVVTESGAVGTARYKIQRKRHTGFIGNTYTSGRLRIPYINHAIATFEGFYGFNNTNFLRISDDKVASWDANGICVINLQNGDYTIFDDNSISLATTTISQIACDATITGINSGTAATKIWVACRVTGLWEIDLDLEVCNQLSSDPCYAVDVGYQGKIFAIFGGTTPRLSNSDNYSVPLDFTNTTITAAWTQVKFLKCDPNSATFRLLINYGSGGATVWWNTSTPAGSAGPTLVIANQNSFDCSDVDSTWFGVVTGGFYSSNAHYVVKLTAGATSATTISTTQGTACAPNPCIIGSKLLVQFGTQTTNNLGQAYSLHNTSDGSLIDRFDFIGGDWHNSLLTPVNSYLVYMGRTLTLYGAIADNYANLVSAFNNASYAFENYGWNGSAWILDNASDRLTHVGAEPVMAGITLAFANGVSGTSFFATDYYDVFYNDGLLKSNTRTFSYTHYVWYREMVTGTIVSGQNLEVPISSPYTVKLPAAPGGLSPDANFLLAYNLITSLFEFKLDGVAVSQINLAGQAPTIGQVTVASDGTLTFNAADAGKLITSIRYAYLRG